MTEKEFLVEYAKELEGWSGTQFTQGHNLEAFDDITSLFLERHHKEYYEVEFIKIDSVEGGTVELMKTMQDFKTNLDKENVLQMDDGKGEKTIHSLYDGTKAAFTKCWEDNEGFQHHTNKCTGNFGCDLTS